MKEVWVKKDNVIKKIQENIASEYKNIGWEIITEKEALNVKPENKSMILAKKEEISEE